MDLTDVNKELIDAVLDEASLLGVDFDKNGRRISLAFSVLWLPEDKDAQAIDTIIITLYGIHRLAASHRDGDWSDRDAAVIPGVDSELPDIVRSFGGLPVYGGGIFSRADSEIAKLSDRLSFDTQFDSDESLNSMALFQEGNIRHLDFWIWFDDLKIFTPDQLEIEVHDLYEGSKRWWEAFYRKDPRTMGKGMYPVD